MTAAVTAKNYPFAKAPRRIELLGDKTRRPESAQHIIEFPGGAIELSRLENGDYWAHVLVNRGWSGNEGEGFTSGTGEVVDARVDRGSGIDPLPDLGSVQQIAVLIRTRREP